VRGRNSADFSDDEVSQESAKSLERYFLHFVRAANNERHGW